MKNQNNMTMDENTFLDELDIDETFTNKIRLLHNQSFFFKFEQEEVDVKKAKMNAFETYVAIIKGYCALMILVLPRSFQNGGYAMSVAVMGVSAYIQYICALKLVKAG